MEHFGVQPPDEGSSSISSPAVDPVCGMALEIQTAPAHAVYAKQDYHFCSHACREKFIADPARYLNKGSLGIATIDDPLKET